MFNKRQIEQLELGTMKDKTRKKVHMWMRECCLNCRTLSMVYVKRISMQILWKSHLAMGPAILLMLLTTISYNLAYNFELFIFKKWCYYQCRIPNTYVSGFFRRRWFGAVGWQLAASTIDDILWYQYSWEFSVSTWKDDNPTHDHKTHDYMFA